MTRAVEWQPQNAQDRAEHVATGRVAQGNPTPEVKKPYGFPVERHRVVVETHDVR